MAEEKEIYAIMQCGGHVLLNGTRIVEIPRRKAREADRNFGFRDLIKSLYPKAIPIEELMEKQKKKKAPAKKSRYGKFGGNPPWEITEMDVVGVLETNGIVAAPDSRLVQKILDRLDIEKIVDCATNGGLNDIDDQTSAAATEIENQLVMLLPKISKFGISVQCSVCHNMCKKRTAHLHQGEWIGDECCWDDRLKASE